MARQRASGRGRKKAAMTTERAIPERHGIRDPRKMSKWEKRRVSRPYGRRAQGKEPLAEPLVMSKKGIVKGKIILEDRGKEISIPLITTPETAGARSVLQGVYRTNSGHIVTLRLGHFKQTGIPLLYYSAYSKGREVQILGTMFATEGDRAHMLIPTGFEELIGQSLGMRAAVKGDRHARSRPTRLKRARGSDAFTTEVKDFDRLFEKMHYEIIEIGDGHRTLVKTGKSKATNDMDKFHTITAIDPETGRVREYVFPVKWKNKKRVRQSGR